jgi:hypothetical protein
MVTAVSKSIMLCALAAACLGGPAMAQTIVDSQSGSALRERALADRTAWDIVESLTTEIGPRLAGTPAAARAKDWGLATLTRLGFKNVHAEPFPIESWVRGAESAEVIGPYPQHLALLGLGRSVPTPPGGVIAPIVVFETYADLVAAAPGSLSGKIAVVVQPMLKSQDGSGYGAVTAMRTQGPSMAARKGAVAYLVRSLSTDDTRLPHAGAMRYAPDAPRIPAAAISPPDAQLLERMAARPGPHVVVRLTLASSFRTDATAWHVVGELPGTGDEVIVIGGHLDSWDPGTGAIDDGTGIAITTAAARLAGETPRKRTIRVVMFGAEEMDFSGAAYLKAHQAELPKIALVGESDSGPDRIWKLALPRGVAAHPSMAALPALLAPLKIPVSSDAAGFGGSDTGPMTASGAPTLAFSQDTTRYFDWHHSADDTLDKVDPASLAQNVAAWAVTLAVAADADIDFRKP